MIIAWDIETCPLPEDSYSPRQQRRRDLRLQSEIRKAGLKLNDPDYVDQVAKINRRVRATHSHLGWICCMSFKRGERQPRSYTASSPSEERSMLLQLWKDLLMVDHARWVTFNGKLFDVPFLRARSLHHGVAIPNARMCDMMGTHKFRHDEHFDLQHFWYGYGLDDVCDLLSITSPKSGAVTAETVHQAVKEGRIAEVAAYCEADVIATMEVFNRTFQLAT